MEFFGIKSTLYEWKNDKGEQRASVDRGGHSRVYGERSGNKSKEPSDGGESSSESGGGGVLGTAGEVVWGSIPHVRVYRAIDEGNYGDIFWATVPFAEIVYEGYATPYKVGNDLYHERYLSAGLTYGGHVATGLGLAAGVRVSNPTGEVTTETVKKVLTVEVEQTSAILAGEAEAAAIKGGGSWAKTSGILRDAVKGKGNYGLGAGTVDEAMQAGRSWVGEGFTISKDGSSWISANGLRQFRPPSFKPKLGIEQANFQWRNVNKGAWQSNGHLDIIKP